MMRNGKGGGRGRGRREGEREVDIVVQNEVSQHSD